PRKSVSSICCHVTSSASRLVLLNGPPPDHLWIGTKSRHVLLPQRVTNARASIPAETAAQTRTVSVAGGAVSVPDRMRRCAAARACGADGVWLRHRRLLRARRERPRGRSAAKKGYELTALQLIELHFIPASQGQVAGYRIGEGALLRGTVKRNHSTFIFAAFLARSRPKSRRR